MVSMNDADDAREKGWRSREKDEGCNQREGEEDDGSESSTGRHREGGEKVGREL